MELKVHPIKEYREKQLMDRRNHFINHLAAEGFTLDEIKTVFRLSKTAIHKIIKKVVDKN